MVCTKCTKLDIAEENYLGVYFDWCQNDGKFGLLRWRATDSRGSDTFPLPFYLLTRRCEVEGQDEVCDRNSYRWHISEIERVP